MAMHACLCTNLIHCSEVGITKVLVQHLTGCLEAVHICTVDTGKSNLQGGEHTGFNLLWVTTTVQSMEQCMLHAMLAAVEFTSCTHLSRSEELEEHSPNFLFVIMKGRLQLLQQAGMD